MPLAMSSAIRQLDAQVLRRVRLGKILRADPCVVQFVDSDRIDDRASEAVDLGVGERRILLLHALDERIDVCLPIRRVVTAARNARRDNDEHAHRTHGHNPAATRRGLPAPR